MIRFGAAVNGAGVNEILKARVAVVVTQILHPTPSTSKSTSSKMSMLISMRRMTKGPRLGENRPQEGKIVEAEVFEVVEVGKDIGAVITFQLPVIGMKAGTSSLVQLPMNLGIMILPVENHLVEETAGEATVDVAPVENHGGSIELYDKMFSLFTECRPTREMLLHLTILRLRWGFFWISMS